MKLNLFNIMTSQQKSTLGTYFTIANFLVLIGFIWQQAQWQKNVENDIETLQKHAEDQIVHMPFEKKIEVFVPRVELEGRMNNIQYTLEKIENKLDKIKNK